MSKNHLVSFALFLASAGSAAAWQPPPPSAYELWQPPQEAPVFADHMAPAPDRALTPAEQMLLTELYTDERVMPQETASNDVLKDLNLMVNDVLKSTHIQQLKSWFDEFLTWLDSLLHTTPGLIYQRVSAVAFLPLLFHALRNINRRRYEV